VGCSYVADFMGAIPKFMQQLTKQAIRFSLIEKSCQIDLKFTQLKWQF
jgi:hypothetical protein